MDYLSGKKNVNEIDKIEDLYAIKTTFFKLLADCELIQENIKKLNLHFLGEFEDKAMALEDIGISKDDIFVCKLDFLHWGAIKINSESEIKIIDFSYAGKNSILDCRLTKHITDEKTRKIYPNPDEIKLLLTFAELKNYFDKK